MAGRIGQSDRVGRSPSNRIVRVHQSPIGRQDRFVSISSIEFDHARQSEPAGHSAIQSFSHSVIQPFSYSVIQIFSLSTIQSHAVISSFGLQRHSAKQTEPVVSVSAVSQTDYTS